MGKAKGGSKVKLTSESKLEEMCHCIMTKFIYSAHRMDGCLFSGKTW